MVCSHCPISESLKGFYRIKTYTKIWDFFSGLAGALDPSGPCERPPRTPLFTPLTKGETEEEPLLSVLMKCAQVFVTLRFD